MKSMRKVLFVILLLSIVAKISGTIPRPFKIEVSKIAKNLPTTPLPTSTTETTNITTLVTTIAITKATTVSSAATSTTTSRATTTQSPATTTVTTVRKKSSNVLQKIAVFSNDHCSCDLKPHICDINCCCDIDCNTEMLKSFRCDEHKQLGFFDFHDQQGLPSCKVNESWLCIFKDNSQKIMNEVYDAVAAKMEKYSWPNYFAATEESTDQREHYMVGDAVMIYNDQTEEVKGFDLPYSLLSPYCQVYEPIRHLKEFSRSCLLPMDQSQDFFADTIQQLLQHKLLKNRKAISSGEHMIDEAHYVNININICRNLTSCVRIENDTQIDSEAACTQVNITIHHNFTTLTGCDVHLICIRDVDGSRENFWRNFQVTFLAQNETLSERNLVSGKYGYKPGSALITGKYVAVNETVDEDERQFIIDYFHANTTIRQNPRGIRVPKSASGFCTKNAKHVVHFGESSLSQCFLRIDNETAITSTSNYTQICANLQSKMFDFLIDNANFSGDIKLYVSQFGWPLNVSANWIKFDVQNFEVKQIMGSYDSMKNSFRCQNIILSVKYEFITFRTWVNSVPNQNILKQASVEFGDRVNLEFKLDEEPKLPIYVSVMFYDGTVASNAFATDLKLNKFIIYVFWLAVFTRNIV